MFKASERAVICHNSIRKVTQPLTALGTCPASPVSPAELLTLLWQGWGIQETFNNDSESIVQWQAGVKRIHESPRGGEGGTAGETRQVVAEVGGMLAGEAPNTSPCSTAQP